MAQKLPILFIFLFATSYTFSQKLSESQQQELDSLNALINKPNSHDTAKALAYVAISDILYLSDLDTVIPLCKQAKSIAERGLIRNPNEKEKNAFLRAGANAMNNLGYVYGKKGNVAQQALFYQQSLKICEEIGDKKGIASSHNNLGYIYQEQGDIAKAVHYYTKSLQVREEIGDKKGIASSHNNLAAVYQLSSDYKKAKEYALKSYQLSKKLGNPKEIYASAKVLYKTHLSENNYKEALKYYEEYITMRDSLRNTETEKAVLKQQMEYEFEKEQVVQQTEYNKNLEIADERAQKQRFISYSAVAGLVLVIAFLVFVFNRLHITRKQKQQIETQKQQVEEAHHLLEEKNKEVMDSIHYAQRIQQALLKNEDRLSHQLPEHFILFQPKDIVSGDFYWLHQKENFIYLAAADCTGHGVPGAFLTMLGTSFLNEINAVETVLTPAEILNELRKRIMRELSQTGAAGESKDGMDISLLRIDVTSQTVQWAGANNPLYVIHKSKQEEILEEIKSNKQPIGYSYDMKPFTNHELTVNKGDSLYIFSDGFADQFGGPKGKKYKYKPFKDKLEEIHQLPLSNQKQLLEEEFQNWKGSLEQVDDVCIIGVRL